MNIDKEVVTQEKEVTNSKPCRRHQWSTTPNQSPAREKEASNLSNYIDLSSNLPYHRDMDSIDIILVLAKVLHSDAALNASSASEIAIKSQSVVKNLQNQKNDISNASQNLQNANRMKDINNKNSSNIINQGETLFMGSNDSKNYQDLKLVLLRQPLEDIMNHLFLFQDMDEKGFVNVMDNLSRYINNCCYRDWSPVTLQGMIYDMCLICDICN